MGREAADPATVNGWPRWCMQNCVRSRPGDGIRADRSYLASHRAGGRRLYGFGIPNRPGSGRTGRQSSPSRIMAASGYARKATSCRLVQTPDHARSQCGRDALPGPNPDFSSPFNRHCASCSWRSLLGCRLGTRAETCCGSGSRSMRRLESRRGRLKSLRHKATRKVR